ncbi:MAG: UDP-glucose 4-epimerase GalE [Proteobacteria bacterium]|nr:UDP-glucose 4-epimerase GalE [Pseudomonadota bacterium]
MITLVTGGAGYIGSHMVRALLRAGRRVVVLDNLSTGHRRALPPDAAFVEADVRDTAAVTALLQEHDVDAVLHFAGLIEVGASVRDPIGYWSTNFGGTLSLLGAMEASGVKRIVFSSTCAVYGEPGVVPIVESCPRRPISPYGRSKLACEHALADVAAADPAFCAVALRYFNVAGAAADGSVGEDHQPETHLIPRVLNAARDGGGITIFGTDFPTPDGTCVRDYVHVEDLCAAHLAALDRLTPGLAAFNLGIGRGFSVREVIDTARAVTGRAIEASAGPRRAGDPPRLFADPTRARELLGWSPRAVELEPIIASAWRWTRQVSS